MPASLHNFSCSFSPSAPHPSSLRTPFMATPGPFCTECWLFVNTFSLLGCTENLSRTAVQSYSSWYSEQLDQFLVYRITNLNEIEMCLLNENFALHSHVENPVKFFFSFSFFLKSIAKASLQVNGQVIILQALSQAPCTPGCACMHTQELEGDGCSMARCSLEDKIARLQQREPCDHAVTPGMYDTRSKAQFQSNHIIFS